MFGKIDIISELNLFFRIELKGLMVLPALERVNGVKQSKNESLSVRHMTFPNR